MQGKLRLGPDTSLTIPARRHLANLWAEETFDPSQQAPVLRLGDIVAMVQAAAADGRVREAFLAAATYRAALRPDEWVSVDRESGAAPTPLLCSAVLLGFRIRRTRCSSPMAPW